MSTDPPRSSGRFRQRTATGPGAAMLLRAGTFTVRPSWRIPMRITEFHAVFLGFAGRLQFRAGGAPYELVPGGVVWLPRHRAHEGISATPEVGSDECVCGVLHFSMPYEDPQFAGARWWPASAIDIAAERSRCAVMEQHLSTGSAADVLRADAALNELLALLLDQPSRAGASTDDLNAADHSGEIASVLDHIAQHVDEPLLTTDLAARAGLQRSQFSAVFKQLTGLSPQRYVIAARIARARELLEHSSLTLETIAHRCGFSSGSHLSRRFIELEGMPPGAYRDRQASARTPLGLRGA